MIRAGHKEPVCGTFAAKAEDKFACIAYRLSAKGGPILDGVVAWIDCALYAVHEAGDHFMVLGEVHALEVERPHAPLLFFQGGYGRFSPFMPAGRAVA